MALQQEADFSSVSSFLLASLKQKGRQSQLHQSILVNSVCDRQLEKRGHLLSCLGHLKTGSRWGCSKIMSSREGKNAFSCIVFVEVPDLHTLSVIYTETVDFLHIQLNLNKHILNLLVLLHLRCFIPSKISHFCILVF